MWLDHFLVSSLDPASLFRTAAFAGASQTVVFIGRKSILKQQLASSNIIASVDHV